MHFRILKTIATSVFLTALKYTIFVFGWAALPKPPAGLRRAILLRERGGEERREGGKEIGGQGKRGEGNAPQCKFLDPAPNFMPTV